MGKRILVVGDIMIDHYTKVDSVRMAPEAHIPVWDELDHEYRLGGAANVANNLKALGGDEVAVHLAGLAARMEHNRPGRGFIEKHGIGTMLVGGTRTMYKHRYFAEKGNEKVILFRVDNFKRWDEKEVRDYERFFCGFLGEGVERPDVVVISDYDKGTVTPAMVNALFDLGAPVIVDSKRFDLSMYRGSYIIKLNHAEYANQIVGHEYVNVEGLADYIVVTKGAAGAELRMSAGAKSVPEDKRPDPNRESYIVHTEDFPIESVEPVDVTGCGDTHTAAMAFSLLGDSDVRRAVRFANRCAASVVKKFGTSVV